LATRWMAEGDVSNALDESHYKSDGAEQIYGFQHTIAVAQPLALLSMDGYAFSESDQQGRDLPSAPLRAADQAAAPAAFGTVLPLPSQLKEELLNLIKSEFPDDEDLGYIRDALISALRHFGYRLLKDVAQLGTAFKHNSFAGLSRADATLKSALIQQLCGGVDTHKDYDRLSAFFVTALALHTSKTAAGAAAAAPRSAAAPTRAQATVALLRAIESRCKTNPFFAHVQGVYFGFSTPPALRDGVLNEAGHIKCAWPNCASATFYTWRMNSKDSFERLFEHLVKNHTKEVMAAPAPVAPPKRQPNQMSLEESVARQKVRRNDTTQQADSSGQRL
jgi:hypothetical protein